MEAAGIEPASEDLRSERLHACPAPKVFVPVSQEPAGADRNYPLVLTRPSGERRPSQPTFAAPCTGPVGMVRRGRGRLMRPLLTYCQQLLVSTCFTRSGFSACNSGLNYPRRALFAPVKKGLPVNYRLLERCMQAICRELPWRARWRNAFAHVDLPPNLSDNNLAVFS